MFIRQNIAPKFRKVERFELTSQLLRASLSIPLNIAEGCGRYTDRDFAHFLNNSFGSASEANDCRFAAFELKYVSKDDHNIINKLINEVRAMLISFFSRTENPKSYTSNPIP